MIETIGPALKDATSFVVGIGGFVVDQTLANIDAVITGFSRGGLEAFSALFPLAILAVQFSLLLMVLKIVQMIWFLAHEARFVNKPKSYSVAREGGKQILIVGDSTAYGTGADKPEDTIAGLLAHDFPDAGITNTAVNGSITREAISQVERAGDRKFDLVIVCTGGNDIWHFTGINRLEVDLTRLLEKAIEKSNHQVLVLFYSNFENVSIFPSFIRSILGKRSKRVHEVFAQVTKQMNVPLVELYLSKQVNEFFPNPFLEDPSRYYSNDRMHPSSAGYRLWYNHMWGEMVAHRFTFAESTETPPQLKRSIVWPGGAEGAAPAPAAAPEA